jgi:hypothetical protein
MLLCVQTAKTENAMVSKNPFLSMVPIIGGLVIGGRKDPV